MQPPEMIGSVRLSSSEPKSAATDKHGLGSQNKLSLPNASDTPEMIPLTTLMIPNPTQPVSTPVPVTPPAQDQMGVMLPTVLNEPQKPAVMTAPVTEPAIKPATDLRGARGSPRMGRRAGRRGVYRPHRRPMVDAAVSAQDRLLHTSCQ